MLPTEFGIVSLLCLIVGLFYWNSYPSSVSFARRPNNEALRAARTGPGLST